MARRQAPQGDLIFSAEQGRMCPKCGRSASSCGCKPGKTSKKNRGKNKGVASRADPGDGVVRISRETKGRKGKGVTLVSGLKLGEADLAALAKALKKRCGTGGTVKAGVIEIQGDQRDVLVSELEARGHTVKLAGG